MSRYSAYLKRMARSCLKGKYGFFILAYLLIAVISAIAVSIPFGLFGIASHPLLLFTQIVVFFMLSVLVNMLNIGFTKLALSAVRREPLFFKDLFYAFTHQTDQFLILELILTGIATILYLPTLYLSHLADYSLLSLLSSQLLIIGWNIIAIFLTLLFTLCFTLSVYLLIDQPTLGPVEALRESVLLMRGLKGRLFYLRISFIGMYALGILSGGIGVLWVFPYEEVTLAMFYQDVRHRSST